MYKFLEFRVARWRVGFFLYGLWWALLRGKSEVTKVDLIRDDGIRYRISHFGKEIICETHTEEARRFGYPLVLKMDGHTIVTSLLPGNYSLFTRLHRIREKESARRRAQEDQVRNNGVMVFSRSLASS